MTDQETLLPPRPRWTLWQRCVLATGPTTVILVVYALVESFGHASLLYTSLAASAFLVYLGPRLRVNLIGTLLASQLFAASMGTAAFFAFDGGYLAAGFAMGLTIFFMVLTDMIHPPAVGTALLFGFRAENLENLLLFFVSVLIVVGLVLAQRFVTQALKRKRTHSKPIVDR